MKQEMLFKNIENGVLFFDGFEDQDLSDYHITEGQASIISNPDQQPTPIDVNPYEGDYCLYIDETVKMRYDFNSSIYPDFFEFYWAESSAMSTGFGIRLYNSNSDEILSVMSDNPQWDVKDFDGNEQLYSGDGYDRWILFRVEFDWDNQKYSVYFEDTETNNFIDESNRNLANNGPINHFIIQQYTDGNWGGNVTNTVIDNIKFYN